MAVSDMLLKLSEATGVTNSNAATRAQLLRYLNTAGRELWNSWDLPGSMQEQFFAIPADQTNIQITLPWYCEQIRGARWAITGQKITVRDFRPRYQATPWHLPFLEWRVRQRQPLHTPMLVEGPLTFVLTEPQEIPITLCVSGQTTAASQVMETIILLPGQVTAVTQNQWSKADPYGLQQISKAGITTCDVNIFDYSGLAVAEIGSRSEQANNILVQISEYVNSAMYQPNNAVELLYKRPYDTLFYDTDIFHSPYAEDSLIWRARANYEALQKDELALQRASLFSAKADELIRQIVSNQESEVDMRVNVAPNKYARAASFWGRGWGKFSRTYRRS